MNIIKILFVEDQDVRNDLIEYFNGEIINDTKIIAESAETFTAGAEKISSNYYDLAVLDLCDGDPSENSEKEGITVLKAIQENVFIPVIFYSGLAYAIKELESDIITVVDKKDGFEALKVAIGEFISSNIGLIKSKVITHVNTELRDYFWDVVDNRKELFKSDNTDYSLGYLMLRRLSNSLSKQNIKNILGDTLINENKVHPMEFYVYPTLSLEYEAGEIIKKEGEFYVLLTPSCDYVERVTKKGNERKVGKVLLAIAKPLAEFPQFIAFKENGNNDNKNKLTQLIRNNVSDRFFFLPKTPFMNNRIVDFQNKTMVEYEDLVSFERVAKLDDPFAQSMIASFIRYYNRIGFPDIDSDYVLESL